MDTVCCVCYTLYQMRLLLTRLWNWIRPYEVGAEPIVFLNGGFKVGVDSRVPEGHVGIVGPDGKLKIWDTRSGSKSGRREGLAAEQDASLSIDPTSYMKYTVESLNSEFFNTMSVELAKRELMRRRLA